MALINQKRTLSEADKTIPEDRARTSGTVIAKGTRFQGTIACPDELLVLGSFEGDIDCGGIVRIAKEGRIYANIYARKIILEGEINGNIESAEYVEIKSEGRLIGNLKAAKIRLAGGCFFEGKSSMQKG